MNAGCLRMNDWHSFTTRSRYEKNNRDYFIASCSHYSCCMLDGVRKITHGVAVPVVVFTGEVAPALAMAGGMVIPVVAAIHP